MRDLARLPKAHLHISIGRYGEGRSRSWPAPQGPSHRCRRATARSPTSSKTITAAAAVLRGESDVQRVVTEIAFDAASDGAVWVELFVWPGLFAGQLGPDEDAIEVLLAAAAEASAPSGV